MLVVGALALVVVVRHFPSHEHASEHPSPPSVFPSSHSSIPKPGQQEERKGGLKGKNLRIKRNLLDLAKS